MISEIQINKYDGYDRSIVMQPLDTCGIPVRIDESVHIISPEQFLIVSKFLVQAMSECDYRFQIMIRDDPYEDARTIPISFSEEDLEKGIDPDDPDYYQFFHETTVDSAEAFISIGTIRYHFSFGYMTGEKDEDGSFSVLTKDSTIVIRDQNEDRVITNADGFDVIESSNNYPTWFEIKNGRDGYGYISVTNRWFLENANAISVVLSGILGAILSQYFNKKSYLFYGRKIKALRDFFYYG